MRLEEIYAQYFRRVYTFVLSLSRNEHTAEEITQETFFRAFSKLNSFRGESDEVTWLCAIARNLVVDEKRRQGRFGQLPEDAIAREKTVEQSAVERDDSFRVHLALHALEEPYREVFELRVFGELSFAQVGQIFHRTENWARVTFHPPRAKPRERLGEA
jgi:RNA polymerase sigma-70 factor (ECF subfamily)